MTRGNTIKMWREAPNHIGVPRELIPTEDVRCEVIDLTPEFPDVEIKSKIKLDLIDPSKSTQHDAFSDLKKGRSGILNLACGAGKTVIMLHAAAHRSKPTLIISHQEEILEQWRGEIEEHLQFKGGVGWIQGAPTTWDWKQPITLAMIRSLAKYRDEVHWRIRNYFGTIIWDEAHHLAAPTFCRTADMFPGTRLGATATVERGDGTEVAYLWHIGGIIHQNLDQDLMPRVTFVRSPTRIDTSRPDVRYEVTDSNGAVHYKKLLIHVGKQEEELACVCHHLNDATNAGRKILALSASVEELERLHNMYPGSGIITGNVKGSDARRAALKEHNLTFGTVDLAKEALNDRALDTLFILTEFAKEGMLQQAVGRIQRIMDGKKNPVVVVIRHRRIPKLEKMAKKMEAYFMRQQFRVEVT